MDEEQKSEQEAWQELPEEAAGLVAALITQSMNSNFALMESLYEGERRRVEELEREIAALRADAYRWRRFTAMMADSLFPEVLP